MSTWSYAKIVLSEAWCSFFHIFHHHCANYDHRLHKYNMVCRKCGRTWREDVETGDF